MYKIKRFLIKLIEIALKIWADLKQLYWRVTDIYYVKHYDPPRVKSVDETIDYIIENKSSASRYGDGEMKLMKQRDISFQKASPFVAQKLKDTLSSDEPNHLVCLCDVFGDLINSVHKDFWKKTLYEYRRVVYKCLIPGKDYYHAGITRQYLERNDKSAAVQWINKIKQIWEGRDVLLIEGVYSRVGVGNDLLDNAHSVKRILGPERDAFSKYNEIIDCAAAFDRDTLILLALGPCATAMALDLHKLGFQAVDIGHIDIEYEWMLAGADKREKVKNKYTNESGVAMTREEMDFSDTKYEAQIINRILS